MKTSTTATSSHPTSFSFSLNLHNFCKNHWVYLFQSHSIVLVSNCNILEIILTYDLVYFISILNVVQENGTRLKYCCVNLPQDTETQVWRRYDVIGCSQPQDTTSQYLVTASNDALLAYQNTLSHTHTLKYLYLWDMKSLRYSYITIHMKYFFVIIVLH